MRYPMTQEETARRLTLSKQGLKYCTKCHQDKPLEEFSNCKVHKDGKTFWCKPCARKSFQNQKITHGLASGDISALRASAKNRGLSWELNAFTLRNWWNSSPHICHYCSSSLEEFLALKEKLSAATSRSGHATYQNIKRQNRMSIDRKNSDDGYHLKNIVKACPVCNYIKNWLLSEQEMLAIAASIRQRLNSVTTTA